MSQEYFPDKAGSSAGEGSSRHVPDERPETSPFVPGLPPSYMTVGNGSTSESATALMNTLNADSGYGGSIADGDSSAGWRSEMLADRPTPAHTPTQPGEWNPAAEHEKQVVASHVHQLLYNSNRTKLARAISRTIETLRELQDMNRQWPAHYPAAQSVPDPPSQRPSLNQTQSFGNSGAQQDDSSRPGSLKRAATMPTNEELAESSATAERRAPPEPRLMSPQIAQEFSILKLDLKLGALSQAELVHSLEKSSIASLLDGKIGQSVKHLLSLRDRIEDISSKVLITGDLNAGKSTFCNALLRRKVLPEDQQPCTSIFCEVLDARENGGLEEVHAVHKNQQYNRNDESTYDVYALNELENIVIDNSKYMQCKVYVKDVRTIDESLLNNGVVDIALIDAPGLNSDSLKTTAVFARQEEIDVVVFVVSAANHFTLSAQDFIWNAAHEKAYMFMVVNGFDQIRDKQRCQRMILDQIKKLSPRTYKESAELVHFVSSNAIPVAPQGPVEGPGGGGGGGGGGGSDPNGNDWPSGDDDDNDKPGDKGKGKGKEKEKIQDFENLESSLRRFVLEKRSRSKLAPARTYLLNLLADINSLASVNRDVADNELQNVLQELADLEPAYETGKQKKVELQEEVDKCIDDSCEDVYKHTRTTLTSAITNVSEANLGVEYPGIFSAFQYAEDLKLAMLEHISASVTGCEDYARTKTAQGVGFIQNLGLLHIGEDKFTAPIFRADLMFRRGRRHALARQVDTEVELLDFFDVSTLWERQEKLAGTGMAMTAVTVLGGRAFGGISWVDSMFSAVKFLGPNNMRRLLVPGVIAAALITTAYMLSAIPATLPPRLSRKIAATLSEMDYVHSNSTRISSEVRRILRVPAGNLHSSLAQDVEDLGRRKQEVSKTKQESEVASKYFANLFRDTTDNRNSVENIDLDGPLPGGLGAYDA